MKRFRVKVCGITRPLDGMRAAEFGADMIGMIFVKRSPRHISLRSAQSITRELTPIVRTVGVFADHSVDDVLRVAERVHLDFIQLSGSERRSVIQRIQKAGFRVIKGFPIRSIEEWKIAGKSIADLIMVDNAPNGRLGGSGRPFDWRIMPRQRIRNLVLAGGIDEANLVEGVRRFEPLVVDVNSGVEARPGIKSHEKLKVFFRLCDELRYGC